MCCESLATSGSLSMTVGTRYQGLCIVTHCCSCFDEEWNRAEKECVEIDVRLTGRGGWSTYKCAWLACTLFFRPARGDALDFGNTLLWEAAW